MRIEAVIFDFGGVIWDMRWDLARELERRHGLPEGSIANTLYAGEVWRRVETGWRDHDAWREAAHASLERIAGRPLPRLHEEWRAGMRLIGANVRLIRRLRPPYRTQVLSNADSTLPDRLRDLGIHDLFDDIVVSSHVGVAKPDRRIYTIAAERLGLPPEACVFIDDNQRNVTAAEAAGMAGIHFVVGRDDLAQQLAAFGVQPRSEDEAAAAG